MGRARQVDRAWGAGTPAREVIARAALQLVDVAGVEAVSIRKLAAELGVHPTSLYRRFSSRDEILDLAADSVLAEIDLTALTGAWDERLLTLATAYRTALCRHRRAAALLNSWTSAQTAIADVSEAVFAALADAGLTGLEQLEAYNTYLGFVHGSTVGELVRRSDTAAAESTAPRQVDIHTLARHPRLATAAEQLLTLQHTQREDDIRDRIFLAGVQTLLAGIRTRYSLDASAKPVAATAVRRGT